MFNRSVGSCGGKALFFSGGGGGGGAEGGGMLSELQKQTISTAASDPAVENAVFLCGAGWGA